MMDYCCNFLILQLCGYDSTQLMMACSGCIVPWWPMSLWLLFTPYHCIRYLVLYNKILKIVTIIAYGSVVTWVVLFIWVWLGHLWLDSLIFSCIHGQLVGWLRVGWSKVALLVWLAIGYLVLGVMREIGHVFFCHLTGYPGIIHKAVVGFQENEWKFAGCL